MHKGLMYKQRVMSCTDDAVQPTFQSKKVPGGFELQVKHLLLLICSQSLDHIGSEGSETNQGDFLLFRNVFV